MKVRRIPMETLAPLLAEQLRGGRAYLPVTGSSMLPMLRGGRDVVSLVPLDGPPERGEVILYRRGDGTYVLHRVVGRRDASTCLCCGDNQWRREPVPDETVIARVDRFDHRGRWVETKNLGYRFYWNVWIGLMPVRLPILMVRRGLGRVKRLLT